MTQNGVYDYIFVQLTEDYNRLTNNGYELFGMFLFGSQNYGLEHEKSDIDVYAVYFSSKNQRAEQTTYFRKQANGNIHPISISSLILGLKIQEKKCLELLFTKYYYINPKYQHIYDNLITLREEIARAKPMTNLLRLLAYAENELNNEKRYVTGVMKRVANVKRVQYLAEKYVIGKTYAECLKPNEEERLELLMLKTVYSWTAEEQLKAIEESVSTLRKLVQNWEAPPDNLDVLDKVQGYFNERII